MSHFLDENCVCQALNIDAPFPKEGMIYRLTDFFNPCYFTCNDSSLAQSLANAIREQQKYRL